MSRQPTMPADGKASEWIQEKLRNEFALALDVFDLWNNFDLHPQVVKWIENGTPKSLIDTAKALNVQGFRLFRSVIRECQACEGVSAAVLARSLFETSLALWFVTKPELCLELGTSDKGKLIAVVGTTNLPQVKRAELYETFVKLENERYVNKHKLAGKALFADEFGKATGSVGAKANAESAIGDWAKILWESRSYSGKNSRELAKIIDPSFEEYYDLTYAIQSQPTHGTDALSILHDMSEGELLPLLYSHSTKVRMALFNATQMFAMNIAALNNNFGLGGETDERLQEFSRRMNSEDIITK